MKINIKNKYNKICWKQVQTPDPKKWKLVLSRKPGRPDWVENVYESKVDSRYSMIMEIMGTAIISLRFYHRNALHRENGPADTDYDYNHHGTIRREAWYRRGKLHRVGGPALINYREDGSVEYNDGWTQWWHDGVRVNRDGTPYVEDVYEDEIDDWDDED